MRKPSKIYSNINVDIEAGSKIDSTNHLPAVSPKLSAEHLIPSKWVSMGHADLLSFLVSRSSKTSVAVVSFPLTLIFGLYLIQLLSSRNFDEVGLPMIFARVIRCLSCVFAWCYLCFIRGNESQSHIKN